MNVWVCEECGEAYDRPIDRCPDCGSIEITPESTGCGSGSCTF